MQNNHASKAILNLHTHSFSTQKSPTAQLDGADDDYVEQPHVDGSNIFSNQNYESVNNNASVTMPEQYWRKLTAYQRAKQLLW